MFAITANNVNDAYYKCIMKFNHDFKQGNLIELNTRGQRRLKIRGPVSTTYRYPRERVLFDVGRDANPFFHFMEALWILAGRDDVEWLAQWLPKISEFSDDGQFFHGAYGLRILRHDQVEKAIDRLSRDPHSSRAVIAIYDPSLDSSYAGKDLPCNCTLFLGIEEGALNLTVANRSNDMIWGAYGANVVQFSTIQEYIAFRLNVKVGWYCQFSNNAHIYPDTDVAKRVLSDINLPRDFYDPFYSEQVVRPYDMFEYGSHEEWMRYLHLFMSDEPSGLPFFLEVAEPIRDAYLEYKSGDLDGAKATCQDIKATDWQLACTEWIDRRIAKRAAK